MEKQFFVTPIQNNEETYEQIIKMGRNNDYTIGNLLDYEYFSKHYKLIAMDNAATVVWFWPCIKQETQKNVNLLGDADNEFSKFATRKWFVINDQNNTDRGEGSEDNTTVKFETKVFKSNLCDYSDRYILATGDIRATGGIANTRVAFENCAPFTKCITCWWS